MKEKYPNPQHNSGEQPPTGRMEAGQSAESTVARERLAWAVSETLLRAVYNAVEHPDDNMRAAAAAVAIKVVQATCVFDLRSEDDRHALAMQANYVADQIVELAGAYDELTTSDLQGVVEALALRIVHNQLPIGDTAQTEEGDHE